MKKLTRKQKNEMWVVVEEVVCASGIEGASVCEDGDNPFEFRLAMPIETDKGLVVRTCNEIFHQLGILPEGKNLRLGEISDYCYVVRGADCNGECYLASFNHPIAQTFKPTDPEHHFISKIWCDWDGE